jgi:hypothetical protein
MSYTNVAETTLAKSPFEAAVLGLEKKPSLGSAISP